MNSKRREGYTRLQESILMTFQVRIILCSKLIAHWVLLILLIKATSSNSDEDEEASTDVPGVAYIVGDDESENEAVSSGDDDADESPDINNEHQPIYGRNGKFFCNWSL